LVLDTKTATLYDSKTVLTFNETPRRKQRGINVMPDLIRHPVYISGFRLLSSLGGLAGMTIHRKWSGYEKENTHFASLTPPLSPRREN
jgi:hypothetical protein